MSFVINAGERVPPVACETSGGWRRIIEDEKSTPQEMPIEARPCFERFTSSPT